MPRYPKLRGRIVELYGNNERFREKLGISKVSMSKKLNGLTGFSQADILKWSDLLKIDINDVGSYFFDKNI